MQTKAQKLDKAVIAIMRTARLVSCDDSRLNPLANAVTKQFQKYESSYGSRFATKLMKAHYTEAVRYACQLDVKPLTTTWIKRSKSNNMPTFLLPHLPVLRSSNVKETRWALSLLRTYESIVLPAIPDLDTVTLPSNGSDNYAKSMNIDFHLFLSQSPFMAAMKLEFEKLRSDKFGSDPFLKIPYSTKAGPKGPACATMGKQSLAIKGPIYTMLISFLAIFSDKYEQFSELINFQKNFFLERKDLLEKCCMNEDTPLGRIAFIPSKGGKTRTVAIGNTWIQLVLQFLHRTLFGVLKSLGEIDGTFNQEVAAERVRLASSTQAVWSFDLTAATDRFPLIFQTVILKYLNEEVGTLWTSILKEMTFKYGDNVYRYEVGQPMGLYASWGMFTISHHCLVQYCAWKTGSITTFRKYAILGDDIAIWDILVAEEYRRQLDILDVNISVDKSFVPTNVKAPGVAEFAKRYWNKGVELSAVSPDLCIQAQKFSLFGEFLHWLAARNLMTEIVPSSKVLKFFAPSLDQKWQARARSELGLSIRITELLRSKAYAELDELVPEILPYITLPLVQRMRVQNLTDQLLDAELGFNLEYEDSKVSVEDRFDFTPTNYRHTIYWFRILDTRVYELSQMIKAMNVFLPMVELNTLMMPDFSDSPNLDRMLQEIEYMPRVDFESLQKGVMNHSDKKELRGDFVMKLAKKAYKLRGEAVSAPQVC